MNNIATPDSKDPDIMALREAIYAIGKTEPSEYSEIGIINGYRVIYMEDSKRYIFGYKKCAIFIKPRIERKTCLNADFVTRPRVPVSLLPPLSRPSVERRTKAPIARPAKN